MNFFLVQIPELKNIDTNKMWLIRPHLFLGNIHDLKDELLHENEISMIISLAENIKTKKQGLNHIIIPIVDHQTTDIVSVIHQLLPIIEQQVNDKQNVLIHCIGGISRSVSIVMAYLMKTENMSYDLAIEFIRNIRGNQAEPNIGFELQIRELFNSWSTAEFN